MYIEESGTPDAPTILFLHGAGIAGWMWQAQVEALNDFHCLVPDLPGHGRSNTEDWLSVADTADKIAEVIRTQATHSTTSIVGISLGGYVGLHLLAHYPELLDRVVISGITIAPLPNPRLALAQFWLLSYFMKSPFLIKRNAQMLKIPPEFLEPYTRSVKAVARQTFWRVVREITYYHVPEGVRRTTVPTLVVAGEHEADLIREAIPTLVAMMPSAKGYLAPGVSHGWNGEAPVLFNAMLRAWFNGTALPNDLISVK